MILRSTGKNSVDDNGSSAVQLTTGVYHVFLTALADLGRINGSKGLGNKSLLDEHRLVDLLLLPAVPVGDFQAGEEETARETLAELDPPKRDDALRHATDDLADTAGEVLTFLEDLPLAEAVRSLEILAEDAKKCLKVAKRFSDGDSRGLRKRLRTRRKAVATELMERRLDWRMEGIFGRNAVAFFERFILILLLLFVIMLAVEVPLVTK